MNKEQALEEVVSMHLRIRELESALESERQAHEATRQKLEQLGDTLHRLTASSINEQQRLIKLETANEELRKQLEKITDDYSVLDESNASLIKQNTELTTANDRLRKALEKIANMDIKYGWAIKYDLQNIAKEALGAEGEA